MVIDSLINSLLAPDGWEMEVRGMGDRIGIGYKAVDTSRFKPKPRTY